MRASFARIAFLFSVTLLLAAPVRAQSPKSDAEVAAKELVDTIKLADRFKALLPMIFKNLKPAIVQNRPDVERDFDALVPLLMQKMNARFGELEQSIVLIYADNFTADELRALIAFYKTPLGQKLLEKTPLVTQQTMAAGAKFGQIAGAEAQKQMVDELRNRGHSI
ncbi:DUF2059 domain-containing protein [Bradyrhizobium sp. dw_78]|uniref:DUF2059 domain-containing protein n=1 Tax=Bradyrhizobium sp. dw_78 TaxID=2719793 RepID=UPI001BD6452F|nr:DUF2059 domain-containing protein [Bradyrhizobium sp. dw_78]